MKEKQTLFEIKSSVPLNIIMVLLQDKTKTTMDTKTTVAALLPFAMISAATSAQEKKDLPNIIFILADDMGIGDLGCYGQTLIKTPGIDYLAGNGIIFDNHYSGSTVSAPSRCVLLTGKHTGHCDIRGNKGAAAPDGEVYDWPLSDEETTVAEILKRKDYTTGCIGKWGLGGPESEGHPNNQGFDYFFGFLGQGKAHRYYPRYLWENGDKVILDKKVYSYDMMLAKALDFVKANSGNPFFLYFTPTIPHADLDVPDLGEYDGMFEETPYVNKAKTGKGYHDQPKPRATYAAMVSRLDKGISELTSLLKELGIFDNTLIIFSSDNGVHSEGGHDPEFFDSNSIYRGQKRDLYEGGIHTPMVACWPEKIKAGTHTGHVSAFWDFLPTVCDIVGTGCPDGTDGISYLPSLTGSGVQKEHDYLYYEFHERGGKRAVIQDGWKLVELNSLNTAKRYYELYDLRSDISEKHNVIGKNRKLAEQLKEIMDSARTGNKNWNFNKL